MSGVGHVIQRTARLMLTSVEVRAMICGRDGRINLRPTASKDFDQSQAALGTVRT